MKARPLLAWGAQVAAHAAYVEARHIEIAPPVAPRAAFHSGRRHSPATAERNRKTLLHALRDGKRHPFSDLQAALPGMTRNGIYYLADALKAEGHIDFEVSAQTRRRYFLTQGARP